MALVWGSIIIQWLFIVAVICVSYFVTFVTQNQWIIFIYLAAYLAGFILCAVLYRLPIFNFVVISFMSISFGGIISILSLKYRFTMVLIPIIGFTCIIFILSMLALVAKILAIPVVLGIISIIFGLVYFLGMVGASAVMLFYFKIGVFWQYFVCMGIGIVYFGVFILEGLLVIYKYDEFWEFSSAAALIHSKTYLVTMPFRFFWSVCRHCCKPRIQEI